MKLKITGNYRNYRKLPEIPVIYRNLQENYRGLPKIIFTGNYRVCIQLSVTNENWCKNWRKLAITRNYIVLHYFQDIGVR